MRENGGPFAVAEQDEIDAWMKAFSGQPADKRKVPPPSDKEGTEGDETSETNADE